MTRDEIIAEIRRRAGVELDWHLSTTDALRQMLDDLATTVPDDRFAEWAPKVERALEAR